MRKHCSNVCNLRPCLDKESNNSAHKRTIVAAALQRQFANGTYFLDNLRMMTAALMMTTVADDDDDDDDDEWS
jgi:hypothetical protein